MMGPEMTGPEIMLEVFRSRIDKVVGHKRGEIPVSSKDKMLQIINSHLRGQERIGFFNALPDSTVLWTLVNFQGSKSDPHSAIKSIRFQEYLNRVGLWSYRERSKSGGNNYHVWMFFASSIPAAKVWLVFQTLRDRHHFDGTPLTSAKGLLEEQKSFAWLPLFGGRDQFFVSNTILRDGYGVKDDATAFVDKNNKTFRNQWKVLIEIRRIPESRLDYAIDLLRLPHETSQGYLVPEGIDEPSTAMDYLVRQCPALDTMVSAKSLDADSAFVLSRLFAGFGCTEQLDDILANKCGYGHEEVREFRKRSFHEPYPTCDELRARYGEACARCPEPLEDQPPWENSGHGWRKDIHASQDRMRSASPAMLYFNAGKAQTR